jgi:hypothetical protein
VVWVPISPAATAEAARQVGGIDAARGATGLRGDEIALRARVLHRRLHLRVLDVDFLAQVRECVLEGAHLLAQLRLGFLRRLFHRLGFLRLGFFSGSGGGGGGGGFGFSTMSCTTRSGRSSTFGLARWGIGISQIRMRAASR